MPVLTYTIAVYKEQSSCYGVVVADLPGCHSAGDTLDEALENAREAIADHVAILKEIGDTAPEPVGLHRHAASGSYDAAEMLTTINVEF